MRWSEHSIYSLVWLSNNNFRALSLCSSQWLFNHWERSDTACPCVLPLLADFTTGKNHSQTVPGRAPAHWNLLLKPIAMLTGTLRNITPSYSIKLFIPTCFWTVPYIRGAPLQRIWQNHVWLLNVHHWVFKSSLVFLKSEHLIIHCTAWRSNAVLLFVSSFHAVSTEHRAPFKNV